MSIYDKSSLVLIPSGTKTGKVYSQKPVSGDGDFTFTRSSAATRVNADGFIEKETQNLVPYSNTFSSWSITSMLTPTTGHTGYDGTSNAWKIIPNTSNTSHRVWYPSMGLGYGVYTISIYAKAAGYSTMYVYQNSTGADYASWFNLSTGSVGSGTSSRIDTSITDVGSGWYRCTLTGVEDLSSIEIYIGDGTESISFAGDGTSGILLQDAQLEQGLVARDYIETTTTAVEGGITDNVPRLDYTDSSCPALLLEPQRTNLAAQSEAFTDSYWATTNLDVIANDTTSPEGVDNASFLRPTTANGGHQIYKTFSMSAGTNTLSLFLKAGNYSKFRLYFYDGTTAHEVYGDCSDGSIHSTNSTTSVEDYGNGWYRYSVTATNNSFGAGNFTIRVTNDSYQDVWAANGTDGVYIYGWQFENGSYATSYIPTYGSSVTRNADGSLSLPTSQTLNDFTLYWEGNLLQDGQNMLFGGGTGGWYLDVTASTGRIVLDTNTGRKYQAFSTLRTGQTHKVAMKRTNGVIDAFVDGVKLSPITQVTDTTALSLVSIAWGFSSTYYPKMKLNKVLTIPSALTDQEAIDLTTI